MRILKTDSHHEIDEEEQLVGYQVSKQEEEEISEKQEEEQISNLIVANIKVDQILPIIIYLGILALFNIMTFFSDTFAYWITEGIILIDTTLLIGLIINIAMILLLVLFIIYLPKINKTILNQIGMFLIGILIGLLLYLIYINNGIELKLGNIDFSFFNLIYILPILILAIIIQIKSNKTIGLKLSTMIFGIILIVIILDIPNYYSIIQIVNYPITFSLFIGFCILSIFYLIISNKYVQKIEKKDKIVRLRIIKSES